MRSQARHVPARGRQLARSPAAGVWRARALRLVGELQRRLLDRKGTLVAVKNPDEDFSVGPPVDHSNPSAGAIDPKRRLHILGELRDWPFLDVFGCIAAGRPHCASDARLEASHLTTIAVVVHRLEDALKRIAEA